LEEQRKNVLDGLFKKNKPVQNDTTNKNLRKGN
jgi:hypothetical protein